MLDGLQRCIADVIHAPVHGGQIQIHASQEGLALEGGAEDEGCDNG